ncbi:MAG: hypothetical protein KBT04_06805 [Bacteroidales bacterium]|nr:hypothetical protein [Candidatus Colimorpha onthohippi]
MKQKITLLLLIAAITMSLHAETKDKYANVNESATSIAATPNWIIGTWTATDHFTYMGQHYTIKAKVTITQTTITMMSNSGEGYELVYKGSYTIENGRIVYNRHNGSSDVIPLDTKNKRLVFDDGRTSGKKIYYEILLSAKH